jgi:hypothetical protein
MGCNLNYLDPATVDIAAHEADPGHLRGTTRRRGAQYRCDLKGREGSQGSLMGALLPPRGSTGKQSQTGNRSPLWREGSMPIMTSTLLRM